DPARGSPGRAAAWAGEPNAKEPATGVEGAVIDTWRRRPRELLAGREIHREDVVATGKVCGRECRHSGAHAPGGLIDGGEFEGRIYCRVSMIKDAEARYGLRTAEGNVVGNFVVGAKRTSK